MEQRRRYNKYQGSGAIPQKQKRSKNLQANDQGSAKGEFAPWSPRGAKW